MTQSRAAFPVVTVEVSNHKAREMSAKLLLPNIRRLGRHDNQSRFVCARL